MIRATLNSADVEHLRAKPTLMLQAIRVKMNSLLIQLQARIVRDKLQGQVLHHRSGDLGRSVVLDPSEGAVIEGMKVMGSVIGATPPAGYGKVHEDGGAKTYEIVPVNRKALMFYAAGGAKVFAMKVVRPPLKQSSFMGSSLDEMRDQFRVEIQQAAIEGMAS